MEFFTKHFNLLFELIKSDLKSKYKNSILGFLWIIFEPLFLMLILYFVFNRFIRFQMENYPLFILSGITLWRFFINTTTQSLFIFYRNREMVLKVRIPRLLLPFSLVLSNLTVTFFEFIIYFIIFIASGMKLSWTMLMFLPYLILFAVFTAGLSIMLALIYPFFKDVKPGWEIFTQALFFLCPIFYPFEIVPYRFIHLYLMNPVAVFIMGVRDMIYSGSIADSTVIVNSIFFSAIFFIVGIILFLVNEERMVKSL
ncbi:MAG: ABC transporter permease [bacterium]|nr:ABC transporter permease [bacterium]